MAGRGRQRTSFGKLQRERARQEKQAAKRAKRHGIQEGGIPEGPASPRCPGRCPSPPPRRKSDSQG